ncbi:hypothetical protein FOMPIDRAFT_1024207, partial [Fomitopsis schrenkii]
DAALRGVGGEQRAGHAEHVRVDRPHARARLWRRQVHAVGRDDQAAVREQDLRESVRARLCEAAQA